MPSPVAPDNTREPDSAESLRWGSGPPMGLGFPTSPNVNGSPNGNLREEQTPDNMDDYPGDPNIAGSDANLKPLADWQAGPLSYMIDNNEYRYAVMQDQVRNDFAIAISLQTELEC